MSEAFRTSPQQERVWRLQRGGASPAYRARLVLRIEGDLDPDALRRAWSDLEERHEALRARLHLLPLLERPVQALDGGAEWLDDPAGPAALPFELDREPTARLYLLRGDRDHRLTVDLPSHLADTQGLANLACELARCYGARRGGPALDDEPVPYTVVAEWWNDFLESEDAEAGKRYWRGLDYGDLPALRLPDEDDGAAFDPRCMPLPVRRDLPPDLLLAAWQALLGRLTGRTRLLVGAACDGRTDEELAGALGLFARYLPVACDLEADARFDALVVRARAALDEARQWQECFAWEQTGAPAGRGEEVPVLPFGFDVQEPAPPVATGGATFTVESRLAVVDRFTVRLSCVPGGGEIWYDASRLDRSQAELLAERFDALLAAVEADPGAAVADLDIVGPAERRRLLGEWNDTALDLPLDRCLHDLFAEQATRTPDRVVVAGEGLEVTFAELDARANRLARALRRLGLGPERLAAICLERSIDLAVALLGVLKAGGAWLPLDPGYPEERLAFMLRDAAPQVLITRAGLIDALRTEAPAVLDLERDAAALARESGRAAAAEAGPDNLAYVIYTSGSTGRPKGVMVRHRSIANRLLWMLATLPWAVDDRVLQKTPLSFDASIWEVFCPLLAGARLVMAQPGGHQDSGYLVGAVVREEVTVLQLVPSLLGLVVEEPDFPACVSLRRMLCGGEALPADLASRFHDRHPTAELVNLYGPTETAIDATWWPLAQGKTAAPVPIGRPLANVRVHLLDRGGLLAPQGVPAELYVAGEGLARGYLERPDLTAERFVPDPFAQRPGERLYRTGDLARRRPDGALEFLGRIDGQVKLRGFRIELGEIEARLRQLPGVRESAVDLREDRLGGRRLVAWVVPERPSTGDLESYRLPDELEAGHLNRGGTAVHPARATDPPPEGIAAHGDRPRAAAVTPGSLREALAAQLPELMVPAVFVLVDALPRTPSGKLDRAALPEPERGRGDAPPHVAPRTPLERALHELWSELLAMPELGVHDNFFTLGGHSLLATQVASRLRGRLGLKVPLRSLFEAPTIAGLAARIETLQGGTAAPAPSLVTLRPGGPRPPWVWVLPAGGSTGNYQDLARLLPPGRPIQALQAPRGAGAPDTIEAMADLYLGELRDAAPVLGGWSLGGVMAFEMARRLHERGETAPTVVLLDSVLAEPEPEDALRTLWLFARDLGLPVAALDLDAAALRELGEDERWGLLLRRVQEAGLLPPELGTAEVRQLFEVFQRNRAALLAYEPRPFPGRVVLLQASEQPEEAARRRAGRWAALAAGGIEVHTVTGDHYTLLRPPHVVAVAEILKAYL